MEELTAQDFDPKPKLYVLVEFPYPSGYGLHVGHAFSFVGGDVYARFQRLQGKNVLFPIGWDAFGLPTENYAIRTGRPPQEVTLENTTAFQEQYRQLGLSFDWSRIFSTTDPEYYRWTQWIFIKLVEKGLAWKEEVAINWCPKDKVGLANEEVIDGRCERCGTETIRRRISQWVIKITAYADRLIDGLASTEFIEKVKTAQINWIGRSEGARIRFKLQDSADVIEVFTTRPDTLWGCSFLVLAPEHPLVDQLQHNPAIQGYIEASRKKSDMERTELAREKDGIFSGLYAIHPGSGEKLPVWISDFVLPTYGTGAIMAVPAHDERDYEFARKYALPILPVVLPEEKWDFQQGAYTALAGRVVDSGPITGLTPKEAISAAIEWLEAQSSGSRAVSYHLRDWIFSRQHYWGEPIPMVFCDQCGWVPVPEEDLPVVLPDVEKYQPTDTGESPLANIPDWVNTTCPRCGGTARRETDTMPNWAGSDWYFLRFTDPHNDRVLADPAKLRYWMPVDIYIGGDEHNTLHLLYSRFIYQFLYDIGAVPKAIPEPYRKRLSHGVILGQDGLRMSKSRGNVVPTEEVVNKYGADAVRTYLMFMGPFDSTMPWSDRTMRGVKRFLDRFAKFIQSRAGKHPQSSRRALEITNQLGRDVGEDFASFKFNTAVAKIMEGLNAISALDEPVANAELQKWVQVITPLAPFMAEEYWSLLDGKGSVHGSDWPRYDPSLSLEQKIEISVQVNGKLRGTLVIEPDEPEEVVVERARELEGVARQLSQRQVQKVIYIPGRTLNIVIQ